MGTVGRLMRRALAPANRPRGLARLQRPTRRTQNRASPPRRGVRGGKRNRKKERESWFPPLLPAVPSHQRHSSLVFRRGQCVRIVLRDDPVQPLDQIRSLKRHMPIVILKEPNGEIVMLGELRPRGGCLHRIGNEPIGSSPMIGLRLSITEVKDTEEIVQLIGLPHVGASVRS